MNEMRRAGMNSKQPKLVNEESSARLKQQRLLEDFLEVQKEFVSKKKRLQKAMQKREILLAEVSFLRQKYTYLKTKTPELESKQGPFALQNSSAQSKLLCEKGNHGFNKASSRNSSPILVSNMILGGEDWNRKRKEVVVSDPLRVEKKRKNNTISEKGVGKKKISWQDQVSLKV